MATTDFAHALLRQEAQALISRLEHVRPFSVSMPMVPAASVSRSALVAIEHHMSTRRRQLRELMSQFLRWADGPGRNQTPADLQRRFTVLRLRFNSVLTQFDIFADVLTQRAEHGTGVWVAGLDVLAEDALRLPGYYEPPPVICYIDRGHGAAIRRARTRLPGGDSNPVAVIQVPRERLVGSGIASSLVHEVGHQAASLLELVPSLTAELTREASRAAGSTKLAWRLLTRWISEIVADFWSVAKVGVTATLGLLAVVSLPRAFVFRIDAEDPHPTPWVRVKLSCAMGRALYPDPQWSVVEKAWESLYPPSALSTSVQETLLQVSALLPRFATLVATHRNTKTKGQPLSAVAARRDVAPDNLRAIGERLAKGHPVLETLSPIIAVAVLGQRRFGGRMLPRAEGRVLQQLLTRWATARSLASDANLRTSPGSMVA